MDRQRWLDRVEVELVGQGLPTGVRAQLLAELQDHLDDLMEGADMAMETELERRMGEPDHLACAASAEYRRTGWVQRHPLLVFGLAPIPVLLLAVTAYVLVFAALGYLIGTMGLDSAVPQDPLTRTTADIFLYGVAFVPFLGVVAILGRVVFRSRATSGWAFVALAQIAILAGLVTVNSTWSDLPGRSQLTMGIGFPLTGWRQAAQMLLPLVFGWIILRRRKVQPTAFA